MPRLTDYLEDGIAGLLGTGMYLLERARAGRGGNGQALPAATAEEPKGLLYDPWALMETLGFRDKPTNVTFETLDQLAQQVAIFAAIRKVRLTQVGNFCTASEVEREPGFRVVLRDPDEAPTRKDRIRARELGDWFAACGSPAQPAAKGRAARKPLSRDGFETTVTKLCRDSLTYDQAALEIIPDRKGLPAWFRALDAKTIRLADVADEYDDDAIRYVQVYDQLPVAEFTAHELVLGIRNPRTDIRAAGYGESEMEMALSTMTALLFGATYNSKFFTQGSMPKGLLNFPNVTEGKIQEFRRRFYLMLTGIANAHRMPITNAENVQYVDLHRSNRDMEFGQWMDWNIKIFCGVCQIDPAELNFLYGNAGQTQQMFQAPAEQKITQSKERGLRPLLRSLATWFDEHLLWPLDDRFAFRWTGLDPRASDLYVDQLQKKTRFIMTVDEARAEMDMEPLPDGKGEVILDPTWLQASSMAAQMQQQGGEEGAPEGEGEEQPEPGEGDEPEGGDEEQPPELPEQPAPKGKPKKGKKPEPDDWASLRAELGLGDEGEEEESPPRAARKSLVRVTERREPEIVTYELEV